MNPQTAAWQPAVQEVWGNDLFDNDILLISRLEILPPYRGHDIGLFSLARLIQMLSSGCGLVVIKPFPLQFESSSHLHQERSERPLLDQFNASESEATEKLIRHYQRLGFESLPGTPLLCLPVAFDSFRPESIRAPDWFNLPLPE